jgi:hypothetical protein
MKLSEQEIAPTLQRMEAEICSRNPNDASSATATLIELDFDIELLDWIDDDSAACWVLARTLTELTESSFLDWVSAIVPDGFVVSAGLLRPSAIPMERPR